MIAVLQYILYPGILTLLAVPLGAYIKKVMEKICGKRSHLFGHRFGIFVFAAGSTGGASGESPKAVRRKVGSGVQHFRQFCD